MISPVRNLCFILSFAVVAFVHVTEAAEQRGGTVQWARLKTTSPQWSRHVHMEPVLLNYIRNNTTLEIAPTWAAADVKNLESLTAYPFLFAESIQTLGEARFADGIKVAGDETGRANLREYLLRGGFLFIDACINTTVNPDPDQFLANQVAVLTQMLPGVKIEPIAMDHAVYRSLFTIDKLPHSFMRGIYDPNWAKHPLYSVEYDGRVVGMISVSGLKCGWSVDDQAPNHDVQCMRMMINIYAYSIMN